MSEEFVKQKYMEMQHLDQQMQQIEQHITKIDGQITEVLGTKQSLIEFEKSEKDNEVLMPVANGIFAKAIMKENKKVIINVGGNVAVEKPISEAVRLMDDQLKELEGYKAKMILQLDKLTDQVRELEKAVEGQMSNV